MRAVTIFISLVVVLLLGAIGGVVYIVMQAGPGPAPRVLVAPVRVEPSTIDLGPISQCDKAIMVKAKLINEGDQPFHVTQVVTSCGCTVPELKTPLRLDPGGSHEFMVTLDPWNAAGPRSQRIDFIYAETGRAPPLTINYDVVSPIRTHPGGGKRQPDTNLIVRITADDGEPFLIERVVPEVAEEWIRTPSPETHLTIDWWRVDQMATEHPEHFEFDADGRWKRGIITIGTSRKGCSDLKFRLYNISGTKEDRPLVPTGPSLRSN